MRGAFGLAVLAAAAVAPAAWGQYPAPKPWPRGYYDAKRPAQAVLDDDAHLLIPHLTNDFDGSQQSANAASEDIDVFAGASALKVTPLQRHSARIQSWAFRIVEKPREGEYRYLRFAWKKAGGEGVMVQIADQNRSWMARYHAGKNVQNWQPSTEVAKEVPKEWTVVTRDLYEDYAKANGGTMTVTGLAFSALDGQHALFDHVVFGRTLTDLDAATAAATGKGQAGDTLEPKYREALWEDLHERDRERAGVAVRGFLASAPDNVTFIADRLVKTSQSPDEVRNRAEKIKTLVKQLGSDFDFDTRLAAEEALEKLGAAAEPDVRAAKGSADPEVQYRVNRLLKRMKIADGEVSVEAARAGRIVRVLERANTADAKELLKKMTEGVYGPEFLDPATAALGRMK